jgi:hypothetical protein
LLLGQRVALLRCLLPALAREAAADCQPVDALGVHLLLLLVLLLWMVGLLLGGLVARSGVAQRVLPSRR